MAKEWSSEELAYRTFMISMAGIAAFIAAAFFFVILN
jgi:hypothetical protein